MLLYSNLSAASFLVQLQKFFLLFGLGLNGHWSLVTAIMQVSQVVIDD